MVITQETGVSGRARPAAATRWAGWAYVATWVVGLVIAPASPAVDADDAEVHDFLITHAGPAMLQSTLVHGLAALLLLVVVRAASRRLGSTSGMLLGGLAVLASLVQLGIMAFLWVDVESLTATTAASTYSWIGLVDTAKLALLGAFVAFVTARAAALPTWLRWVGLFLAPLLPVSGAAFLVQSQALYAALYFSLPLLLVWVAGVSHRLGSGGRSL